MRRIAFGIVAVAGAMAAADAFAAWPFGRLWEKRRAELYSSLSRDVSVRVDARVGAAQRGIEESLEARFTDEAKRLEEMVDADSRELDERFDDQAAAIEEAVASETKALRERIDSHLAELKKVVDAEIAEAGKAVTAAAEAESKKLAEKSDAKVEELRGKLQEKLQENIREKLDAEIKRIERESAAGVGKVLESAEKKIVMEVAGLQARIDERLAAAAKRLAEERAAAKEPPKPAPAPPVPAPEPLFDDEKPGDR